MIRSHSIEQKDEVLPRSYISNKTYPTSHNDSALFRQPVLPTRTGHFEPYRLNMNVSFFLKFHLLFALENCINKTVNVNRYLGPTK